MRASRQPSQASAYFGSRGLALARRSVVRAASMLHRIRVDAYSAALVQALKLDSARHPDRAR